MGGLLLSVVKDSYGDIYIEIYILCRYRRNAFPYTRSREDEQSDTTGERAVGVVVTHLRDISLELPAQLHQVLVGMFTLLLSTRQLRCYRVQFPLKTHKGQRNGERTRVEREQERERDGTLGSLPVLIQ